MDPVPATQRTILCYIAYLARTLKPQSISNYTNIIRLLHLEAGLSNPLENNFGVKNLKRGIARKLGAPPKQKQPITAEIMMAMYDQLSLMSSKEISFWACCCVGFFGFLRKSTLLPTSSNNLNDDGFLQRGDVEFLDNTTFLLHIKKTKTIQNHERVLTLPFVSCPVTPLCPVTAVMDMIIVSPIDDCHPLFSYIENGDIRTWTHSSFTTKLKSLIKNAGFDQSDYSCHSFRRGGATLAFRLGMTMNEIKKRGDWVSSAVNEYVYIQEDQELKMAESLVRGAAELLDML